MYRKKNARQLEFPDFYLPFSGHLDPENRWIVLATIVPWQLAEEIYIADLCEDSGAPIIPARTALGALLIKEKLGLTDRETVATIQENPYLQFFIGCEEFSRERPFDASMMVGFRKRFGEEGIQKIAEAIALSTLQQTETTTSSNEEDEPPAPDHMKNSSSEVTEESTENNSTHCGKLIVDATCTPADIRYPTEVSLLNEARKKTDEIIDERQLPLKGQAK